MNKKIKELSKLLGVISNSQYEMYEKNYQLLLEGIGFEFCLNYNIMNQNTLLASFLNQNIFDLELINNINKYEPNKNITFAIPLFKDEEYSFKFWNKLNNELVFDFILKLEDIGELSLSKIFSKQLEMVFYDQNMFFGEIKLIKPSEKNRNEIVNIFETNNDEGYLLSQIKNDIITHHKNLVKVKDPDHNLVLLIHRLKLWNYDFSLHNYESLDFQQTLQNLTLNSLGIKDLAELEYLNSIFFKKISNEELLKDVTEFGISLRNKHKKNYKKYLKSKNFIKNNLN